MLGVIVLSVAALSYAGSASNQTQPHPAKKRLLKWADIEAGFKGTVNVPGSGEKGQEKNQNYRFGYSAGIHAQLENGNLLMSGHPHFDHLAEIRLPQEKKGGLAERIGPWHDLTGGLMPRDYRGESYVLGGLLQVGKRIYFTKHQWYNANGRDWPSQGYAESGKAYGLWNVSGPGAHSQRIGGYMAYAPAQIVTDGYTYLAGQQGQSGAAGGRWGPNLFAVRHEPTAAPSGNWPSKPLIYHDSEARRVAGWWVGDRVSGAAWIETETYHGVLFLLYQQMGGQTWYGESHAKPGSPYRGDKGFHASGFALKAWIYDPADLISVYRGERQPWSLKPVEETVLIERAPGSTQETHHSFLTGTANAVLPISWRNRRLIIAQPRGYQPDPYEAMPKVYVIELK